MVGVSREGDKRVEPGEKREEDGGRKGEEDWGGLKEGGVGRGTGGANCLRLGIWMRGGASSD